MTTIGSTRLARGGIALHRQVYLVLRDRIAGGALAPGTRLPAEPRLCEAFGVSRITLRRAVADLQAEGLLERVHGRGTFVAAGPSTAPGVATSRGHVEDLQRLSAETRVSVLEFGEVPAPARAARWLGVAPGTPVQRSVRLRSLGRTPLLLLEAFVPLPLGARFGRAELRSRPLFELLAAAGVRFGRIVQEMGASLADPVRAQRLRVEIGAPLLQVDRLVHDRAGRPVEFVEIFASPARSRMVFEVPAALAETLGAGRFVHLRG